MYKKIIGWLVCILLITNVLPFTTLAINPKNSKVINRGEKYTVYISGRYLTNYDRPHSIKYFNLWHLSLFKSNQSGSWVNFSFTQKTLITIIVNSEPRIIQGPVNIYLGLTEPGTFMFLWWPTFSLSGIGHAKIFGVCDTINIFEHSY